MSVLKEEDKIRLFTYYKTIPKPVRPRYKIIIFQVFGFIKGYNGK
ncbi:hypothetical protein [Bacillus thuringiensis]|nr:hypothetical protein [Bacillus thuringiensis]